MPEPTPRPVLIQSSFPLEKEEQELITLCETYLPHLGRCGKKLEIPLMNFKWFSTPENREIFFTAIRRVNEYISRIDSENQSRKASELLSAAKKLGNALAAASKDPLLQVRLLRAQLDLHKALLKRDPALIKQSMDALSNLLESSKEKSASNEPDNKKRKLI